MKLLNFALVQITASLIIGILLAQVVQWPINWLFPGLFLIVFLLLLLRQWELKKLNKSYFFNILSAIAFILVGYVAAQLRQPHNIPDHYSHLIAATTEQHYLALQVREQLKPSTTYNKYLVEAQELNGKQVSGKILLHLKKDSLDPSIHIDDVLYVYAALAPTPAPLNPHAFDYGRYLRQRQVHHQIFTDQLYAHQSPNSAQSLSGLAARIRNHINGKLSQHPFEKNERALINALLLGQRQDIDPDLYNSYTKAGAVHILAVSGLHVGMILLLLQLLFKPLDYLKHGRLVRMLIILLLLWSFALVAGLSASVTRAVSMFSIVAIGINLKRPSNIYNTLTVSLFLLLLFNPGFLFEVGFQMSYLAVFSIVSLQPKLVKLWRPKIWAVDKLWQILTVTTAAQLGVMPLSLFYFHQFPGLFFISNLVIIPLLELILGGGILVILLAVGNLLPAWLVLLYGGLIRWMNHFVEWVAQQEKFVLSDLPFTIPMLLLAYLLIWTMWTYFNKLRYKRLVWVLVTVIGFQTLMLYEKKKYTKEEMVVFHKTKNTLIGHKNGHHLSLSHTLSKEDLQQEFEIKNYKIGEKIESIKADSLRSIYKFQDQILIIVDQNAIVDLPGLAPDYILLTQSAPINLERLLRQLQPKAIVADGSNYKSAIEKWASTCAQFQVPLHFTGTDGAFVLK